MSALDRRRFLVNTMQAGAASLALPPLLRADDAAEVPEPTTQPVRVGFVGMGMKGSAHYGNLLSMAQHHGTVEIVAICDIRELQCREAQDQAERRGLPRPTAYFRGVRDFERMCQTEELDLVYTATPWNWHTPVCVAAMSTGSHAATEVPAAVTLDECFQLVETAKANDRHCCMMENVNYMRPEMAIWQMVRDQLLGELVYYEGGYLHDTRHLKAHDENDGLWLAEHHHLRNGSLYPTHAIGPAGWYLDLGRGDRMDYLVSMSTSARGLGQYMTEHLPEGHAKRERPYANGDVNACLIQTASGRGILIKHDTDLPRPYSRRNLVQGTRGIVRGWPTFNVSLDTEQNRPGMAGAGHGWDDSQDWLAKYEHPLWTQVREHGLGSFDVPTDAINDGAMWHYDPKREIANGDFLEDFRLIDALVNDREPDFNVYDAAAWSAIAPLSEQSVANRSAAVDFPDFTDGAWKTTPPLTVEV